MFGFRPKTLQGCALMVKNAHVFKAALLIRLKNMDENNEDILKLICIFF